MLGYALAAGAIALAVWLLMRRKRKQQDLPARPKSTQVEEEERVSKPRHIKSEHIVRIAENIRFSVVPVVLRQVKVGDRFEDSPFPADGIDVRKATSLSDFPRTLGTTRLLPPELQAMSLLTGRSMTIKHTARVDELADVVGVPRNNLTILQDVSGSMKDYDRYSWAVELNKLLITRAEKAQALLRLVAFNAGIRGETIAEDEEAYASLRRDLAQLIMPNGGTDLNYSLDFAFDGFEEVESDDRKLVLVTDGTQSVDSSRVRQRAKALSVEIHVVCIGVENYSLRDIADRYDFFPD